MKVRRILLRIVKITGWIIGSILVILACIILIIRTEWAQNKIVGKVTAWLSEKTGGTFSIGRIYLTFSGNVQIENVFVAGLKNDTLLYSKNLVTGVEILPLLRGNIHVTRLEWEGVIANVERSLPDSSFNFDFIVRAFASDTPPDTASTALPEITVGPVQFSDIRLRYTDEVEGIRARIDLGRFGISSIEAGLEQERIHIGTIELSGSHIAVYMPAAAQEPLAEPAAAGSDTITPFTWPGWTVSLDQLVLSGNTIRYDRGITEAPAGTFDPDHIGLDSLHLRLSNVFLKEKSAGAELQAFGFGERSGFILKELAFGTALTEKNFRVDSLRLITGHSSLKTSLGLRYESIDSLMARPLASLFELAVDSSLLSVKDAFYFSPELAKDPQLIHVSRSPLSLRGTINGSLPELHIGSFEAGWGDMTRLSLRGTVSGLPEPERLQVDIPEIVIRSGKQDLQVFMPAGGSPVNIPAHLQFSAAVSGSMAHMKLRSDIRTSDGNISADATFGQQQQVPHYATQIGIDKLNLGKLLGQPSVQRLSGELVVEGRGSDPAKLEAMLRSHFSQLELNGYNYSGLILEADAAAGNATAFLAYSDSNLVVQLDALARLDTANPSYSADLRLDGANLAALRITPNDIRAKLHLQASFEGTPERFKAGLSIQDGLVLKEGKPYPVDSVMLRAEGRADSTGIELHSPFIAASAQGNAAPDKIADALLAHFGRFFQARTTAPDTGGMVSFSAMVDVRQTDLLSEVLVPGLESMDPARLDLEFSEREEHFHATLDLGHLNFSGTIIDSLRATAHSNRDTLGITLGFKQLQSGPADIRETALLASVSHDSIRADLTINDSLSNPLLHIASQISTPGDTFRIHIDPRRFILDGKSWNIPPENEIVYAPGRLAINRFTWENGSQRLALQTPSNRYDALDISFNRFNIGSLTSIINPEEIPLSGEINGEVALRNLFGGLGFIADIEIDKLHVLGNSLGQLQLRASNPEPQIYVIDAGMNGAGIDLGLNGRYTASEINPLFEADLRFNDIRLAALEPFTGGAIRNAKGSIRGNIHLSGNPTAPEYGGEIKFDGAGFAVSAVNGVFMLSDELIVLRDEQIRFERFRITDANGRQSSIGGHIGTVDFANPSFDLRLVANDFELLNSTRDDNELLFGKAVVNADIKVTGDLNKPVVNAETRFNKETRLTFVVPETQAEVVERDGVVLFVNMKNPNDPLTNQTEKLPQTGFAGMDLSALLKVDPASVFRVVVDERSGDYLEISGLADLDFSMDPSGRMSLSGIYEVSRGEYKMSLYGLVKREFELAPGSRISWSGDMMGAKLDMTALYKVKTSASALMADQLTGADQSTVTRYRQQLPFEVQVNIKGMLLKPEISFAIDMPEEQRGALGGNVYARLQQLNDNENELNQQVFFLLVTNNFAPAQTPAASTGGSSAADQLARSSVSQVLSGQLNSLSQKYLKGVDVGVDLESYTDYQSGSAQDRTQLNLNVRKTLFNERVSVQVGSQVDLEGPAAQQQNDVSDIIGDITLEYMLTPDGRYRLRGFRRNQFEGLIEGQLIVTGASVSYGRDFNRFKEMFAKPLQEEENSKGQEK